MVKSAICAVLLALVFALSSLAQPPSHSKPKPQRAPDDSVSKVTILFHAKTAALVVRAKTTVACPDGAPRDCIRTDHGTISQVENLVNATELWSFFEKANTTEAELILDFEVREGTSVAFTVRDADSNQVLYSENREVVSLDNDINRIIAHFLSNAPPRTEAEQAAIKRKKDCSESETRWLLAQSKLAERRQDYEWKNKHYDAGVMDECNLHWKDFVCLAHGAAPYTNDWTQSAAEFLRKLGLEYEELTESQKQVDLLRSAVDSDMCKQTP